MILIKNSFCFSICLSAVLFKLSYGLECYVCTDQEDNVEKCLNTIKTCEQEEDVCLSTIKWGSTPYWSQGAKKQYYISKRCSTKANCKRTRERYMPDCTHIWYQDWSCSECCQGDRCNYFVINGTTSKKSQMQFVVIVMAITSIFKLIY